MLFNSWDEVNFLLEALRPDQTVLEWGSGGSTIEIARRVEHVYSYEHDARWFVRVKEEIALENLSNVTQCFIPKNKEELPGHDGTLEDYRHYVHAPLNLNMRFDVVLIDGRARVECAKVAAGLLKPDGIIFIHDYKNPNPAYRRHDYEVVETFLEEIGGVYALYKFRNRHTDAL